MKTNLNRSHLRSWQREAISRAAEGSLLIAAAPGAGKAVTKLTSIADGLAAGNFRRVLLVAPRLIIDTVLQPEGARWEQTKHLTFSFAHRYSGADRRRALFEAPSDIVTCTPDLLPRFVEMIFEESALPFDAIFIDEAQAFKNATSVRTKALLALGKIVRHVVLASGTPTPNGVINAWTPGRLVDPGNLFWGANPHKWRAQHFDKVGSFSWRPKPGAEDRIRKQLSRNALSIRLRDSTDIPQELYVSQPFEHPSGHKALIRRFMDEREVSISNEAFATSGDEDGGFLVKLHQLTNGFAYLGEQRVEVLSMARVEVLEDIVSSVDGPVLAGVTFKADAAMIRRVFPKAEIYTGATANADREDIIDRWNRDKIPLLLGNPSSMGHGLNLQLGSAQTLVWYSAPFSWELYAQMNARLVRGGQKKVVSIITLESDTGIDRAIASVLQRKSAGEKALMDALDVARREPGK
jgi:SNF2 family DNA or RNA helicase